MQRERREAAEAAALLEEVRAAEAVSKAALNAEETLKRKAAEAEVAKAKTARVEAEAAKAKAATSEAEAKRIEAELAKSLERMEDAGIKNLSQGPCSIM